jgi:DNA (cytosine-5)-methyltransferase 1
MGEAELTFGSLFAGIGGLDLGLERAGLECRWQVEIDPEKRDVLARQWPDVPRDFDVRNFPPRIRSVQRYYGVDLVVGGDPCQENSGQRIAAGCSARSLGADFLRVVEELRPPLVLRENPSRVRSDAPWPWWRFRAGLRSLGYEVVPFRLRACCLGADHQRERLFLLASLPDADGILAQPREGRIKTRYAPGAREALGQERERIRAQSGTALRDPRDRVHGRVAGVADGVPARLDGRYLRGYGEAVPPVMGEWIGRRLMDSLRQAPAPMTPPATPRPGR